MCDSQMPAKNMALHRTSPQLVEAIRFQWRGISRRISLAQIPRSLHVLMEDKGKEERLSVCNRVELKRATFVLGSRFCSSVGICALLGS